jgi:hypothetical protein
VHPHQVDTAPTHERERGHAEDGKRAVRTPEAGVTAVTGGQASIAAAPAGTSVKSNGTVLEAGRVVRRGRRLDTEPRTELARFGQRR